jgi:S-adenosylmethionine decarboxylase
MRAILMLDSYQLDVRERCLGPLRAERRCFVERRALGRHLIVDMYGCSGSQLDDVEFIKRHMVESALRAKSTIVNTIFHHFSPWGVSGVVVIAESNISIHTWPEYGYAAIDIFTCGNEGDPWKALEYLRDAFSSAHCDVKEEKRGLLHAGTPAWREPEFHERYGRGQPK